MVRHEQVANSAQSHVDSSPDRPRSPSGRRRACALARLFHRHLRGRSVCKPRAASREYLIQAYGSTSLSVAVSKSSSTDLKDFFRSRRPQFCRPTVTTSLLSLRRLQRLFKKDSEASPSPQSCFCCWQEQKPKAAAKAAKVSEEEEEEEDEVLCCGIEHPFA